MKVSNLIGMGTATRQWGLELYFLAYIWLYFLHFSPNKHMLRELNYHLEYCEEKNLEMWK